jgi:hypothetical protein
VGAGEHTDGVELDRAETAQHRWHPATAAVSTDKSLRLQRYQPYVVGGQGYLRYLSEEGGHNYGSLTVAYDIPPRQQRRPGADRR